MNDTVKLIVEIPKDYYEIIKHDVDNHLTDYRPFEIIANGTLLDDVKAEIEKQIERDFAFAETETLKVPCHYGIANGLQVAVRILDNIGKSDMRGEAWTNE